MQVRMWCKGNTFSLLLEIQTPTAPMEINMTVFQKQKIGNLSISIRRHTTLGHKPKRCSIIQQGPCSTLFIAILFVIVRNWKHPRCPSIEEFVIARNWKQPRCPSIKEWIKILRNIYTVKYCSAAKNLQTNVWN